MNTNEEYIEAKVTRRRSLISFIASALFLITSIGFLSFSIFLLNFVTDKMVGPTILCMFTSILWVGFGNMAWWMIWKNKVSNYFAHLYRLKLRIDEYENGTFDIIDDLKMEIRSYNTNIKTYANDKEMLKSLEIRKKYAQSLLDNL